MKIVTLIKKQKIFFLCLILFFFILPIVSAWSQKSDQVRVVTPSHVVLGDPFLVKIFNLPAGGFYIKWLGKKGSFSNSYGRDTTIILGSDIKRDTPGTKILTIYNNDFHITKKIVLKKRKITITKIQISHKYMNLSKLDLQRYEKERSILKKIFSHISPKKIYASDFASPVSPLKITSPYGRTRIINDIKRSIHTGIDIRAKKGTKIRAINFGKVLYTGDFMFSGKSIFIDHGQGIISMYFHLDNIWVTQGDFVKKGQVIGVSGSTGRVSGPHLHLGVAILGKMVNPEKLIKSL